MQLGSFAKDPKTSGFIGAVRTLTSAVDPVRIVPRQKADDAHKDAPDYDVFGPTGSDFGAGWTQKRQSDSIEYISLRLYDPTFNGGQALRPALWPRKDGSFVMIHEPIEPQLTAEPAPVAPPARPADMNGSGRGRRSRPSTPAPGEQQS